MNSLRILTNALFDYAGMFPPASLSLSDALKLSSKFNSTLNNPALVATDIVLSLEHLSSLTSNFLYEHGFSADRLIHICVLGGIISQDIASLQANLRSISEARSTILDKNVFLSSLELRLDSDIDLKDFSKHFEALTNVAESENLVVFLEPDLSDKHWEDRMSATLEAIENVNESLRKPLFGFKVRGTGPSAIANDRLASVCLRIVRAATPFKATAGLHHPIIEKDRYANSLGFLNLSSALAFLRALDPNLIKQEVIVELLDNSDSNSFDFSEGLRWMDFSLSATEVERARNAAHFSIGSCSLHEPDADLKRLFPSMC